MQYLTAKYYLATMHFFGTRMGRYPIFIFINMIAIFIYQFSIFIFKFYLQDTKSSNGTFVNNQRLSKGSEESTPREVCSGDIVQFGVDVMENSRKGEKFCFTDEGKVGDLDCFVVVTHGCIVATLKLYLPDGKEAKARSEYFTTSSLHSLKLIQPICYAYVL